MTPVSALLYLRLSDLRADDPDSFEDREKSLRHKASQLGWTVAGVVTENDLVRGKDGKVRGASAFKRRKITLPDGTTALRVVRPGFRSILDDLASGRATGLLAEDLDRVLRDPRDLEDLIDVAEAKKINARSLSGSLTFTDGGTDSEITMARVMVTMGNKSSRDTRRRVSDARARKANNGEFGGGGRPYGFEANGLTPRWDECLVIETASRRVVQGASLRSLALELREADAPSISGKPWSSEMLRSLLLRPRNAARMIHQGEEIGRAPWPAIVAEDVFRAVVRTLTDPNRSTGPGAAPKYIGTGIYRCGKCNNGTSMDVTLGGRVPRYRCRDKAHLARNRAHVDAFVLAVVAERLSRPDAVSMFATPTTSTVDVTALRGEAEAIRTNLREMATDRAMGLIDRGDHIAAVEKGRARITEIEEALKAAVVESPVNEVIGAADVHAALADASLSLRRQIIAAVAQVTILPTAKRGSGFDPDAVRVELDPSKWVA